MAGDDVAAILSLPRQRTIGPDLGGIVYAMTMPSVPQRSPKRSSSPLTSNQAQIGRTRTKSRRSATPTDQPEEKNLSSGEKTSRRILAIAMQEFAQKGFDGAATRTIASRANIKPPALLYHFGGKQGLYLACAEHLLQRSWPYLRKPFDEAENLLAGNPRPAEVFEAICNLLDGHLDLWLAPEADDAWRHFFHQERARTAQQAYARAFDDLMYPPVNLLFRLFAKATGRRVDNQEMIVDVLTFMALGPALSNHAQSTIKLLLGWKSISHQNIQQLKEIQHARIESTIRLLCVKRAAGGRSAKGAKAP